MGTPKHDEYAKDLLFSLSDDHPEREILECVPNPKKVRNTARAMAAILCHRLFENSTNRPTRSPIHKADTTYDWKHGTFNCRNIADRGYFWTNIRPGFANEMHDAAKSKPAAYLFACCEPADTTMSVWAVPEPLLHEALAGLPFEKKGEKWSLQIMPDKQRIARYEDSPDLTPYYRQLHLGQNELLILKESREVDAGAKLGASSLKVHDLTAPPTSRVRTSVLRIVRDTAIANRVKKLHKYECQICGHTLILADGSRYAEGHHVRPLGAPHTGPDVLENIVCLCPNHHAACDLGAIFLDLAQLRHVNGHRLNQEYIDYHNECIFQC